MEGQKVLIEFWGVAWTIPLIGTAIGGIIGTVATLYKLYERWITREERHLSMLHEYLDKEERNISSRRREVLTSIQLSHHSYLLDKKLDVGEEIDSAVSLLDSGRPDRAEARLKELLKKLQNNAKILERRIEDLKKHERSVNIFLAAAADSDGKTNAGLGYISDALISDSSDLDALRYKGLLLLKNDELDLAKQTFDKLRINCSRSSVDKAEAHFGLGSVAVARGIEYYEEARQSLGNALTNLNGLPPADQVTLTKVDVHELFGKIYSTTGWDEHSVESAKDNYRKALKALSVFPQSNLAVSKRKGELSGSLWRLENPQTTKQILPVSKQLVQ